MKYAHLIKLTVFSYEHESSENILNAFLKFFPFNLEENKIVVRKSGAAGFNESKIIVFEVTLAKDALINQFLDNLISRLEKDQKTVILDQVESRLDKDLNFFIRFDKDNWIDKEKLIITDSGKCFHLKISVAAFPKKREIALNAIKELFKY